MSRHYENAKIYKLVSNKTADVYIGSCLITLARRLWKHKSDYNSCSSKRMFEVPDAIITIVQIEALPNCRSKAEMKARELHYMTIIPCINVNRPFVTDIKGVRGDNKEWHKAYHSSPERKEIEKKYKKDHATELAEYHKQYNADHATEILDKKKAYDLANREKLNRQARERYAKNKEEAKREIQTQSPLLLTYSKERTPSV